jgi:dUTP pyrophosphatase
MEKDKILEYIERLTELSNAIDSNESATSGDNFMYELETILVALNDEVETSPVFNQNSLNVGIQKLREDAVIPSYSKDGDAGMDITATHIISNTTFDVTYGTGLALEVPKGYVCLIFPRSSIKNYELFLSNSVGVLDSGYRGELMLTFNKKNGLDSFRYKAGDRIGQIIILPFPLINFTLKENLSKSERNTGGFGHTGN